MLSKSKDERRGEGFPKQVVRRPIPEVHWSERQRLENEDELVQLP